ncbi:hypothetical protein EI94DRAFT_1830131 [Lactarius quietus]|nr:hypothetical protein EI94DRAFT_1830131 [Lactarius quietus]
MSARGDTEYMKVTLDTSLWKSAFQPTQIDLQLPLELLHKIFLLIVEEEIFHAQEHDICSGRPDWIAITHVCRYWRSAALGQRELWSSIIFPCISISWSQAMLNRSASLPMRIIINIYSHPPQRMLISELLSLLSSSRICMLSLSGIPYNVLNVLNHLSSPSLLDSLSLTVLDHRGNPVDLPVALHYGDAPHLRRLAFKSSAWIRAPFWLLSDITHFTTSSRVSLYEFLDTLQAMRCLEVLCIVNIHEPYHESEDEWDLLPTAELPYLSLLSFRDHNPELFAILSSHIDAPPTLRRHYFWQLDEDSTCYRSVTTLTALQEFIPGDSALGANDGGLRATQIGGLDCRSLKVWSRTCSEGASRAVRENALFLLHIEWYEGDPPYILGFLNSFKFIDRVACIEDLTIAPEKRSTFLTATGKYPLIERVTRNCQWQRLLACLPVTSVKTLRLYRGQFACVSVLQTLSASEVPILPHLQRVIVANFSVHSTAPSRPDGNGVTGGGAGCSEGQGKFVQDNVGPELVEFLSGRSGLEVVLAGCEVDKETLDTLQKRARVYIGHERVYV